MRMNRSVFVGGFVIAIIFAANLQTTLVGQEETNVADTAEAKAETIRRLPPGYSDIITNSQRRKIYLIQEKYQSRIDELQQQIMAIETERDSEVSQVLDDEQKEVLKFILKIRERNRTEEAAARLIEAQ